MTLPWPLPGLEVKKLDPGLQYSALFPCLGLVPDL